MSPSQTVAIASAVEGSITSKVRPPFAETHSPPMNSCVGASHATDACEGARLASSVGVAFTFTTIRYQSGSLCDQYRIGLAIGVNIDQIGLAGFFRSSEIPVPCNQRLRHLQALALTAGKLMRTAMLETF
ncbi:hypothetical protein GGI59_006273 [Rhizobium lentis]|uniref:Uncharacterized protein n=1 Tax=Rhizobium lentis TaxID=1138194 RepID=A0A7W8XKG3_9HYPH|nr:hypothetical protein [Rhizobium lentis]MBB5564564.1 hypothetical protein [Rhizobium lentis]